MRKNHTANFKAQLVLEMLKEEKTVSELASTYGVHPTMLHRWKKQAVADLPGLFERNKDAKAAQEASEQRIEELYKVPGASGYRDRTPKHAVSVAQKKVLVLTRPERLTLLDWDDPAMSLKSQAELLSLNRSGLCYRPLAPSSPPLRKLR